MGPDYKQLPLSRQKQFHLVIMLIMAKLCVVTLK